MASVRQKSVLEIALQHSILLRMNILEELQWRGLLADCTDPQELAKRVSSGPITLYCGFDPTADSLHAGNLVPLLGLRRFQLLGHHPIALAGGATGSIGDPSGKTQERQLLTKEVLANNIAKVKEQLRRLLDFDTPTNPARLLDNASWTAPVSYLDFLRDIGKHFSVNQMVAKESVRARMEDREAGISYTEFSYMLLQAFDFYVQCRDYNCELQIGGSDQWGNITAGIDLTRKKLGRTVFGLTLPLITNADGSKFGKTEAGAVWLDPGRTSVYKFYQYWIRTDDRDVVRYLKFFTFLGRDEIAALEKLHTGDPGARAAHKALAKAFTQLVHGPEATAEAMRASELLFRGAILELTKRQLTEVVEDMQGGAVIAGTDLDGHGLSLVDFLVKTNFVQSKGEARRLINGGGLYLNEERQTDCQFLVSRKALLHGLFIILRRGKRDYYAVRVV